MGRYHQTLFCHFGVGIIRMAYIVILILSLNEQPQSTIYNYIVQRKQFFSFFINTSLHQIVLLWSRTIWPHIENYIFLNFNTFCWAKMSYLAKIIFCKIRQFGWVWKTQTLYSFHVNDSCVILFSLTKKLDRNRNKFKIWM